MPSAPEIQGHPFSLYPEVGSEVGDEVDEKRGVVQPGSGEVEGEIAFDRPVEEDLRIEVRSAENVRGRMPE